MKIWTNRLTVLKPRCNLGVRIEGVSLTWPWLSDMTRQKLTRGYRQICHPLSSYQAAVCAHSITYRCGCIFSHLDWGCLWLCPWWHRVFQAWNTFSYNPRYIVNYKYGIWSCLRTGKTVFNKTFWKITIFTKNYDNIIDRSRSLSSLFQCLTQIPNIPVLQQITCIWPVLSGIRMIFKG